MTPILQPPLDEVREDVCMQQANSRRQGVGKQSPLELEADTPCLIAPDGFFFLSIPLGIKKCLKG